MLLEFLPMRLKLEQGGNMKYTDLLSNATEKLGSYFLLCNILSQRVKQLENGAEPKIYTDISDATPNIEIALREIVEGKLDFNKQVQ